jgi:hypothetical protein
MTQPILVIDIKNSATCFASLEPSSGDGFYEPKNVAEFLVSITNTGCVTDWINYCIIA